MKAYITKYWESTGIIEVEGELRGGFLKVKSSASSRVDSSFNGFFKNTEFSLNESEARQKVHSKCEAKIKGLEKKLTKLKFSIINLWRLI